LEKIPERVRNTWTRAPPERSTWRCSSPPADPASNSSLASNPWCLQSREGHKTVTTTPNLWRRGKVMCRMILTAVERKMFIAARQSRCRAITLTDVGEPHRGRSGVERAPRVMGSDPDGGGHGGASGPRRRSEGDRPDHLLALTTKFTKCIHLWHCSVKFENAPYGKSGCTVIF